MSFNGNYDAGWQAAARSSYHLVRYPRLGRQSKNGHTPLQLRINGGPGNRRCPGSAVSAGTRGANVGKLATLLFAAREERGFEKRAFTHFCWT